MPVTIEEVDVVDHNIDDINTKIRSSGEYVLLKFTLENCPACDALSRILNNMNTDAHFKIISLTKPREKPDNISMFRKKFQIKNYPTLVLVDRNLHKIDEIVGARDRISLQHFFDRHRLMFLDDRRVTDPYESVATLDNYSYDIGHPRVSFEEPFIQQQESQDSRSVVESTEERSLVSEDREWTLEVPSGSKTDLVSLGKEESGEDL